MRDAPEVVRKKIEGKRVLKKKQQQKKQGCLLADGATEAAEKRS